MKDISNIFNQVENQVCWRSWRGAGYTIFLEMGKKFPNRPKEKELKKGEYTIGLTSCPWHVFQNDVLLFGTDSSYAQIDEALPILQGKTIEAILLNKDNATAQLKLTDSILIKIGYQDPRDEWCILTPQEEAVITKEKLEISPAEDQ
ncbi:MAG: hypothetical protein ABI758_06695 [Candidatus Woesebacteria bacterium]